MNELIKRSDLFLVPATKLKILDDFNLPGREDEGIDELAESLYQNGPKIPMKGYKDGDFYVVVVGHRRFAAAQIVKQKYKKTLIFPFVTMPKGTTMREMLLEHFTSNDGEPLTPLQKAFGVKKLIENGMKPKEIAKQLGYSEVYVNNLFMLANAPAETHALVKNKIISSTLLIQALKRKIDLQKWIQEIGIAGTTVDEKAEATAARMQRKATKAATGKKVKGSGSKPVSKTAKVTSKKLQVNSVKEMKIFIKKGGVDGVAKNKAATFHFVDDLLQNKHDYQDIVKFFTEG